MACSKRHLDGIYFVGYKFNVMGVQSEVTAITKLEDDKYLVTVSDGHAYPLHSAFIRKDHR